MARTDTLEASPVLARPRARLLAFVMAMPLALLQAVNVVRVVQDAPGFASYMGLPLETPVEAAWVQVYALRTAFIALLVLVFLLRRNLDALKWTALAALVMPLGDAWLTHAAGAPMAIVARHLAIATYLLLTVLALTWATSKGRAHA